MSTQTYRSKIDRWLVIVLLSSSAMCLAIAVIAIMEEGPALWPIVLLIVLVGVGLPAWLFAATEYTLTETDLLVRSGPFRWRVPLRDIKNVRPSRDLLSSPALSIDRLRIDYGRGRFLLISPRERDEFLRELELRRAAQ